MSAKREGQEGPERQVEVGRDEGTEGEASRGREPTDVRGRGRERQERCEVRMRRSREGENHGN